MPTVALAHVTVRYELIDLPSRCPSTTGEDKTLCNADLTAPGALGVWEWETKYWLGHLRPTVDELTHNNLMIDHVAGSESGESWIELFAYHCMACGAVLAEGSYDVHHLEARS